MKHQTNLNGRAVYIIDGCRTPFLKAKGVGPMTASDLAVAAGKALLNRQSFSPDALSEVVLGAAMPGPDEANIARVVALRLGCGEKVPAFTVMRNCASGMQALDNAAMDIASGRADLVLAGGVDAMSHAPIMYSEQMAKWLAAFSSARTMGQKAQAIVKFRPSYLAPVIALLRGLTDPVVGLNMGQTAEKLAYRFGLTREALDTFAAQSHQKSIAARENQRLDEIVPIIDGKGRLYTHDDGVRDDSTVEKLAKLKPYFDKKYGMVTAGNSSQITDGAALLILASEEAVKKYNLKPRAKIVDCQWAALDPSEMGLGPVHATLPLLKRHHLKFKDLDTIEINEAFAAQVLACVRAFDDEDYIKSVVGTKESFGKFKEDKLNPDGGAIACGHPIGASGARIVLHVMNTLEAKGADRGLAAICIGGGQGGAMLIERVTEEVSK